MRIIRDLIYSSPKFYENIFSSSFFPIGVRSGFDFPFSPRLTAINASGINFFISKNSINSEVVQREIMGAIKPKDGLYLF